MSLKETRFFFLLFRRVYITTLARLKWKRFYLSPAGSRFTRDDGFSLFFGGKTNLGMMVNASRPHSIISYRDGHSLSILKIDTSKTKREETENFAKVIGMLKGHTMILMFRVTIGVLLVKPTNILQ